MTNSSIPIGVYVGYPNASDPAATAKFESDYNAFTKLMGVAPTYVDTYVDYTQPVSQWIDNSGWAAGSSAGSAVARTMIPVIGLPMASTAPGSMTPDQQFQAFASGQYDSVIQGIVKQWSDNGFKNLVFRPGWEMNLTGPTYAGSDAQSQADWVAAFKHIYTVIHQAAAADGVTAQVMWNPGTTNYSNAGATTNLYPGDAYVDSVGADVYSDIHPYSDSSPTPSYHDWDTGGEDATVAQFIADPINRAHYWTYPAATEWTLDSSGGHSQSLASLIAFAGAHGKPFAVAETGAGNYSGGADVKDDAAFPVWLAQQLAAGQASGVKVEFVNIWDSDGGGNYNFTDPADGKPLEAAAWAAAFGPPAISLPTSSTVILGAGPDLLALQIAEDAYLGNAQFTISVDGTQIGDVQTTAALNSLGATQAFNVRGNFTTGTHTVSVNFVNDLSATAPSTGDRNLFVSQASIDNVSIPGSALSLGNTGSKSFSFQEAASASDKLILGVSEDAWQGDAQYTVSVDGQQIGGVYTATASHAADLVSLQTINGSWGKGAHTVGISFINDAYGGSSTTDRNLYINSVNSDGKQVSMNTIAQLSNGTATVTTPATSDPGILKLYMAGDAYQGNAQFTLAINGTQIGGAQSVTAINANGASQAFSFADTLSATQDIAVSFTNDLYNSTSSTPGDRNLYVVGAEFNGVALSPTVWTAKMFSNGTSHFSLTAC